MTTTFFTWLSHAGKDDNRPVWLSQSISDNTLKVTVLGMDPSIWLKAVIIIAIQSITALAIAVVVLVAMPVDSIRQRYIIGYGVLIPVCLLLPIYVGNWWHIDSLILAIPLTWPFPSIILFRVLQAIYRTLPEFVYKHEKSEDDKSESGNGKIIGYNTKALLCLALLIPRNYELLSIKGHGYLYKAVAHLVNNYFMALLTSVILEAGVVGLGLQVSLCTGWDTIDFSIQPMTKSQSVADFWGNRWNRIVGSVLRGGVYKPMQMYYNAALASLATFAASGLLHEYVLMIAARQYNSNNDTPIHVNYGKHFAFFAWNEFCWILEYVYWGKSGPPVLQKDWQQKLQTVRVLLMVLPIAHWFLNEYIAVGFYSDLSMGFPRVLIERV